MVRWNLKMTVRVLSTAAALALFVSVAAVYEGGTKPLAAAPGRGGGSNLRQMSVETQTVKMSDVGGGQVFTGAVSSPFSTNISAKVSGRVTALEVKVGDRVGVGQQLATIDTSTLQQQLDQQKSALGVSMAQYNKARNDYNNTLAAQEKSLDAQEASFEKTKADQDIAVNNAKQALSIAQAQLDKAQNDQVNGVNAARQTLLVAQAQLNKAVTDSQNQVANAQNTVKQSQDNLTLAQQQAALAQQQAMTAYNNSLQKAQLDLQQATDTYNKAVDALNSFNAQQAAASAAAQAAAANPSPTPSATPSSSPGGSSSGGSGTTSPADKRAQLQSAIDAANAAVQQKALALSQIQAPAAVGSQSVLTAQNSLANAASALLQAQNSQAVSLAQTSLDQAQNGLNTAMSQSIDVNKQMLAQSQLSLDNAVKTQQTTLDVAQAQLAEQQQALNNAKSADLNVIQSQLAQAQTTVNVLSEQLQDGKLISPVAGIVTAINTPVGQNAGAQAAILTIAAADPVQATVNVPEGSIGKIKVGSAMSVNVPTLNKSYEGTVLAVRPTMDPTTKSYGVDIKLDDPNKELLPGMFASSSLKSEGRQSILVPADAVLNQPSGNAVFIVENGKAKKVSVKIGTITSTSFEIVSGLKEGDQLVVKGQELLSDNVPVQVGGPQPGQDSQGQGGQRQGGQSQGGQGQSQGQGGQGQKGRGGQRQRGQGQSQGNAGPSPSASPDAKAGAGQ